MEACPLQLKQFNSLLFFVFSFCLFYFLSSSSSSFLFHVRSSEKVSPRRRRNPRLRPESHIAPFLSLSVSLGLSLSPFSPPPPALLLSFLRIKRSQNNDVAESCLKIEILRITSSPSVVVQSGDPEGPQLRPSSANRKKTTFVTSFTAAAAFFPSFFYGAVVKGVAG